MVAPPLAAASTLTVGAMPVRKESSPTGIPGCSSLITDAPRRLTSRLPDATSDSDSTLALGLMTIAPGLSLRSVAISVMRSRSASSDCCSASRIPPNTSSAPLVAARARFFATIDGACSGSAQ